MSATARSNSARSQARRYRPGGVSNHCCIPIIRSLMNLTPLPAFQDNYLWLLHDGQRALVVDPGDAAPVQAFLAAHGLRLEAILVTHHHPDHVGGVDALRDATGARVYGPAHERIPEPLERLSEGDAIEVLGLRFDVMDVPGHTSGHIAYYCASPALADG